VNLTTDRCTLENSIQHTSNSLAYTRLDTIGYTTNGLRLHGLGCGRGTPNTPQ